MRDGDDRVKGVARAFAFTGIGLGQMDEGRFQEGKAKQKDKFSYRNKGSEGVSVQHDVGSGVAGLASGVLVSARPPASAQVSEESSSPRPRDIADRLLRQWAARAENPVKFIQEQKAVVALVLGQVEAIVSYNAALEAGENPLPLEQMTLLLHGQGGTGKTEVVTLLRHLIREVFGEGSELVVASSNSAARVIGGETIHSGFKMHGQQSFKLSALSKCKVHNDFVDRMCQLEAVIVEEVSMVQPALLGAASYRMCKARASRKKSDPNLYMERGHMFGKVPLVMLLGDFYQLPPVKMASLLQRVQPNGVNEHIRNGQAILLDGVTHAMFLYETHRFKDRLVEPPTPCPFMPGFLETMRKGEMFTKAQKEQVRRWVVRPGKNDKRLQHDAVKDGFEMAIGWEAVHRQMQYRAAREARQKGQMLLYVQAVDLPHSRCGILEHMGMLQVPNINHTGHLIGMCPLYIGMRVRLTAKVSAKHKIVQDAVGEVVDVRFHPQEFSANDDHADWRSNLKHEAHGRGYYRCNKLPRAVFVKFDDFEDEAGFGSRVVQVAAHRASWQFNGHEDNDGRRVLIKRAVTRYQFPLVPERVRTVQTAQGLGMDSATMDLQKPANMSPDEWWLHLYVMFSRVRVSHRLLVYNLPPWEILERGPPAYVRNGVAHFEKMMRVSFAVARQKAQEFGWDVGDGPTGASGAAGAGAAAQRGEGAAPESSSAPVPPTVPRALPLGPPRSAGSSAGDGEQVGVDDAAGAAAADGAPAAASAVRTPLSSHALGPGEALKVPAAFIAPDAGPAGRGRGRGRAGDKTGAADGTSAAGGPSGGGRGAGGRGSAPRAARDARAEVAAMLPTRYPRRVPELLRTLPPGRDLCADAYGVSREDVLRELQWCCGARGIANLGDTCFVNAVAQVLLRVEPVRRVLDAHVQRGCPFAAHVPNSCPVCALADQAAALAAQDVGPDKEACLAVAARKGFFPTQEFRMGQCDAASFFRHAVQALGAAEALTWCRLTSFGERSAVQQHIFGIFMRNRTVCETCKFVADDVGEIQNMFWVSMQDVCSSLEDQVDLQQLLRRQIRCVEHVDGACPAHTHLSEAERRAQNACRGKAAKYTFWDRLPPVFFVTVERAFGPDPDDQRYDRRRVRFPQVLKPEEDGCDYEFSGVVVHIPGNAAQPSVHGGHYVAYGVVGENQYACFNDSTTRNLSWRDFAHLDQVQRGAYVFAYVRSAGARAHEVGRAAGSAGSAGSGSGGGGAASSASAAPSAPPSAPAGQEASGGEPPGKRRRAGGGELGAGDGDSGASGQPQPPPRRGTKRGLSPPAPGGARDEDDDAGRALGVPSADPAPSGVEPGAGASPADREWLRFTPNTIDQTNCLARTWGSGVGAQCRIVPAHGCDVFCKKHFAQQGAKGWHGRVDGAIPEAKLKEFQGVARRASRAVSAPTAPVAGTLPEASPAVVASTVATRAGAGSAGGSGRWAAARAEDGVEGGGDCSGEAAVANGALDASAAASASAVAPRAGTASGGIGGAGAPCAAPASSVGGRGGAPAMVVGGVLVRASAGAGAAPAARPRAEAGPRIATFGIPDLVAHQTAQQAREAETARRRREDGERGRLTDSTGADIPRSDPHRWG